MRRDGTPWWREAVIYQVYVRSFADGDGDGVGDLLGIRTRLPYLRSLGVDALWITPFYRSPMADGGYDVADYRDVDPLFGSLADADALLHEAHELGLRVIMDVVPNHTSEEHPWFRKALVAPPGSPERDRYHFRPGRGEDGELPPNDWESIFGGPAWTRTTDVRRNPGEWYLHLFAPEQPDLNWDNEEVRAEFESVLEFWLDRGVDGFRVDVAHGMVKQAGLPDAGHSPQIELLGNAVLPYFDQDGVHDIHRSWRRILEGYDGERIGVAEAWAPDVERLAHYVRPDEMHQAFNFHFLKAKWDAAEMRGIIADSLATSGLVGAPTTWVLSNHDVQRHVTRYGGGDVGLRRARAATMLMLALPGSAYLYQGEELGLPEVTDLPDSALQDPVWERSGHTERGRDGCRVPMPWSGISQPYGFSSPGAKDSWLPVPNSWTNLTVDAELADPDSMLSLYREALRIRRETEAFGDGTLRWHDSPVGSLLFTRPDEGGAEAVLCAVNTSTAPLILENPGDLLLASGVLEAGEDGRVVVPQDTSAWWRISGPAEF